MTLASSSRNGAAILWIALHTAEGSRRRGDLYNFFDTVRSGSSHGAADGTGLDDGWVPDDRAAWTLLNGNPVSLNLEMCAFARWTREQWLSEGTVDGVVNPRQMVRNAAEWARRKCEKHGIPKAYIGIDGVAARRAGIIAHRDYTYGAGDGDHTDIGLNFPWDVFFADMNAGSAPEEELIDLSGFNGYALEVVSGPITQGDNISLGSAWLFDAANMTLDFYDATALRTACTNAKVPHIGCSGERVLNLLKRVRAHEARLEAA